MKNSSVVRYSGHYIGITERDGWEYAMRTNASAVVVLVPVTDQDELVLVEQYRIPVQAQVIELPAGLVGDLDDPDEQMLTAAQRELEEETGFRAGVLTPFLACPSSAGLTDETIAFYLAENLEQVGAGGGDQSEDIIVHRVPLAGADEWLVSMMQAGCMLDPKIYAALYWMGRLKMGMRPLPASAG